MNTHTQGLDQIKATDCSGARPAGHRLCLAVDALITWYDDFAFGHKPTDARLRLVVANLYTAGPHPDPTAAGDINLLVRHGPRHLTTQALLAIERLRLRPELRDSPDTTFVSADESGQSPRAGDPSQPRHSDLPDRLCTPEKSYE